MKDVTFFEASPTPPHGRRLATVLAWVSALCLLAGCGRAVSHLQVGPSGSGGAARAVRPVDVGVLEGDCPYQRMPVHSLNLGIFPVAYSDPTVGGDLRSVRVAPPEAGSEPYLWGPDFSAAVDAQCGTVELTFLRDGEYIVRITRESPAGVQTTEYMMILYRSACGG